VVHEVPEAKRPERRAEEDAEETTEQVVCAGVGVQVAVKGLVGEVHRGSVCNTTGIRRSP